MLKKLYLLFATLWFVVCIKAYGQTPKSNGTFLVHVVNPEKQALNIYWRDVKNKPFKSIGNLILELNKYNTDVIFAMNGGMYMTDNAPLGLYVENGKTLAQLNNKSAAGNFYLKPNGVFYIQHNNKAGICVSDKYRLISQVKFATQSGPMLVINGKIHAAFKKGSTNTNIRNGVGILPNGNVLFVMSKTHVNFFDFATFFLSAGCKNALYLDGFVSQTYLPAQNWIQKGGNFGVIIAEISKKKREKIIFIVFI